MPTGLSWEGDISMVSSSRSVRDAYLSSDRKACMMIQVIECTLRFDAGRLAWTRDYCSRMKFNELYPKYVSQHLSCDFEYVIDSLVWSGISLITCC